MGASESGCAACRQVQDVFDVTMAFQPVVDIEAGHIDAYEALVRGRKGESAGQILGGVTSENRYSFDQTCRVTAIALAARLQMNRQLNINFLPNAVYDPRACIRLTLETAAKHGFPLDQLTFEIVEDERSRDVGHLLGIITEYRKHGFKIALDDFSTGYSGLSLLAELKPDIIKLDRALIRDCDQNPTRLAVAAKMLDLGREIGIKVVVEGVERIGEVEALRRAGARFMQGFYFARPAFEAVVDDAAIPWLHADAA
jgi:EAL domain-containing protein (putative c-di-GMP-specific phosphodiesterase class I)